MSVELVFVLRLRTSPVSLTTSDGHRLRRVYLSPDDTNISYETMIREMLRQFFTDQRLKVGDCLVFIPNMPEIVQISASCARILKTDLPEAFVNVDFLQLLSDASTREQLLVHANRFTEDGVAKRKVIFVTDAAASSLEQDTLRLVIITGKMELLHYDPISLASDVIVVPCSQQHVERQCNRVGRVSSGVAMHCFTKAEFDKLLPNPACAQFHSDITMLLIKTLASGVDLRTYQWPIQPFPAQLGAALSRLLENGIIDSSPNIVKIALTDKGRLAAKLDLDPEMTNIFQYACPQDGMAPKYAYGLLVLIAIELATGPIVRPIAEAGKTELKQVLAPLSEISSDHHTSVNIWLAWRYHYRAGRDVDFCGEQHLNRFTCLEVKARVEDLSRHYFDHFNVRLEDTSEPLLTLSDLRKCLLNCLSSHLAVLRNPRPEAADPETGWRCIHTCGPNLEGRDLWIDLSTDHGRIKPLYVVYSSLRAVRTSVREKTLYMENITAIPAQEVEEWGKARGATFMKVSGNDK